MPRSKRDKKISLTKTTKKGADFKQNVINKVQSAVEEFEHIFIFHTNNIRNGKLKNVRTQWKDSRFLFGKNKVMAHALGRTEAQEIRPNLHKLASKIEGQCGLLFTNRDKKEVIEFFNTYRETEFPSAGFVPSETITIPEGSLPEEFIHSMEPMLRKLGMPVLLKKGVILVLSDFTLCKAGKPITPEQSRLLVHAIAYQFLLHMTRYMPEIRVKIFTLVALNKKLEQGFHVVAHTSICRGLVIAPEPRHTKLTEPRHMENC